MKQIITLIIIILLIITTFVIPVNSSIFSLNMANIFEQDVDDTTLAPNKIVLSKLDGADDLFCFAIDSTRSLSESERNQLNFEASLTDYSGNTRQLTLDDFNYDVDVSNQRTTYHIKDLKTPALYRSDDIRATVTLLDNSIELSAYVFEPTKGLSPNGKTAEQVSETLIPIYYSSEAKQVDFPVYTKPLAGNNDFRQTLNCLSHTPNYPGLKERPRFPRVDYIWYAAGVLQLKLITADIADFSDAQLARSALNNLLKSFEYTMSSYVVNKISLSVDGQNASTAFGGIDLSQDFDIERNPLVYLPLIQGEQVTWVPQPINASESPDDMCRQIIAAYKNPMALTKQSLYPPMLSKSVELKSVQVVANTLKLTFNQAFEETTKNDAQYCATLLEGLALSVTSLPFIDDIELYVDGRKLTSIGSYQIPTPITAPTYFNVDLDYLIK